MRKILIKKYPEKKIIFDTSIRVEKFPFSAMTLEVDGRIDIKFKETINYNYIKQKNRKIGEGLPGIRFYWNHFQLNIYTEKDFNPEISIEGLKIKIDKFIHIIDHVYENLKLL